MADGARLVEVDFGGWIGTGHMARKRSHRARLGRSAGRPMSVVAKVASADETVAAFSFQQGGDQTELNFYDQIAATVDCRVPIKYRTECRPDDLEFALDGGRGRRDPGRPVRWARRGPARLGDRPGCRAARAAIRRSLAARRPMPLRSRSSPTSSGAHPSSVDVMVDRLGDGLRRRGGRRLPGRWHPTSGLGRPGPVPPSTAVHGDMRASNLLFGHRDTAPPIAVVSTAPTVRPGGAANDLTYLALWEHRGSRGPKAHGNGISWRPTSIACALAGVSLDPDEFFRAYRLGSIWGLLITSVATMSATAHRAR
ncbi:MAG: hypothetical protein U5R31_17745 [Acidimicrobiia bacterium]|nr:hypothetical protein [Acidimicrobiia bacterium]